LLARPEVQAAYLEGGIERAAVQKKAVHEKGLRGDA